MLKKGTKVTNKGGLQYVIGADGKPLRIKPWMGNALSFLYDFIVRKSIMPKKFGAEMAEHHDILRQEMDGVHGKRLLELAAGTGSAAHFLPNDNRYTGIDISPGLLKQALNRFRATGFKEAEFYVASADNLPFEDESFDLCICFLSLNFFDDLAAVLKEVRRVLAPGSGLLCAVPVPERNARGSTIRGELRSEDRLASELSRSGLRFESIPRQNGALLYFRGIKE